MSRKEGTLRFESHLGFRIFLYPRKVDSLDLPLFFPS